jgi:DNA repair exonuclease SbcCD ATPase subunit
VAAASPPRTTPTRTTRDDDAPLGKAGQRALEALKEQRKAARTARDQAKQEAEDLRRKLAKYESANKSELQRLIDERDALKDQLTSVSSVAKRRDAAEELAPDWATAKQVRFVAKYVTGSTDEELEAAAEELYAQLAPKEPAKPRTPARPKERLRPGQADPEDDDLETDPRKLADAIRRNR